MVRCILPRTFLVHYLVATQSILRAREHASLAPQQAGKRLTGKQGKCRWVAQMQKNGKGKHECELPGPVPHHLTYTPASVVLQRCKWYPGQPAYTAYMHVHMHVSLARRRQSTRLGVFKHDDTVEGVVWAQ